MIYDGCGELVETTHTPFGELCEEYRKLTEGGEDGETLIGCNYS